MTQLAIIRHGHTEWNRAGQIQGSTDIPLEAQAIEDLEKLVLPGVWLHADLVSSPLQRAVQTAALVGDRAPAQIDALTEMDWGDWEGKRGVDLKAIPDSGFRDMEDWGWTYRPPNGESPKDVSDRVLPWALGLKADTVAVCHIGIMRVLLAHATGWNFAGPAPFRIKRNRLYVLEIVDGALHLVGEPVRLQER